MTRPVGAAHYARLMADPYTPMNHAIPYWDVMLCRMLMEMKK